ncbi:immunity 41 family protein [Bariatricus massiliensis]|uniref:Immunity 41 family protein n=1 Tax=Bariatricus massiliensis TaxID=1745713 RepID=A0ABS8DC05_9FIRM|nr:Imm41 family immunity protein [Bariatricus massiliensis]MCB7303673.1 immunity 41 family protein [Bariatricus massiliensis]MCB7373089.1 immunity 41 family protein [Bariatricus massiliensis]MCB7385759.1 immunity 41 family protein [Bariatricus massiliensis]MCB7409921.1 immunity 41 family protein [Bariatricus massiliensis]MCQ5253110.1 immunity 41 family protein [Bariatricus massiliensis]
MDELKVLNDNFEAEDNSFLYYLHEENYFHKTALAELCGCISSLCHIHPHDKVVSARICFIYGQVLRHLLYHFDPGDLSQISNLPCNYNEELETLEHVVTKYFSS